MNQRTRIFLFIGLKTDHANSITAWFTWIFFSIVSSCM